MNSESNFFKSFKLMDIFHHQINFYHKGNQHYRTLFGIFLTFILFAASSTLGYLFGKEIVERKNPFVTVSQSFNTNVSVDLESFPIFTEVYTSNNLIDINKYISIKAKKIVIDSNYQFVYYDLIEGSKFVKCSIKNFKSFDGKIDKNALESMIKRNPYCLEFPNTNKELIKNKMTTADSITIEYYFAKCDTSTAECPEDLDLVVNESYIILNYIESYLDYIDFHNPVKNYINSITTKFSTAFTKTIALSFQKNIVLTDEGWILQNKVQSEFITLGLLTIDVFNPSKLDSNLLAQAYFEFLNTSFLTYRSYLKLQNLLASIGGIVNAFAIILNCLFSNFIKFQFLKETSKITESQKRLNVEHSVLNDLIEKQKNEEVKQNNSENLDCQKFKQKVMDVKSNNLLQNNYTKQDNNKILQKVPQNVMSLNKKKNDFQNLLLSFSNLSYFDYLSIKINCCNNAKKEKLFKAEEKIMIPYDSEYYVKSLVKMEKIEIR